MDTGWRVHTRDQSRAEDSAAAAAGDQAELIFHSSHEHFGIASTCLDKLSFKLLLLGDRGAGTSPLTSLGARGPRPYPLSHQEIITLLCPHLVGGIW